VSFEPRLPDERVNVSERNPLAEAALLVGGLTAVVALLALGAALAADWLVPRLPPGLEMKLFGAFTPAPREAAGAEEGQDDPRAAHLQRLLERLERHWPENPYPLRASVWWGEQNANAFALPGGTVAVTEGLLAGVESENELAFVLGHEIGHFRNRDHLKGLGRGLALGLVLGALGMSGVGPAADVAALAGQLAQRSFDREQESAADRFGLELVAAEYGHVAGALDFLRRAPESETEGVWLAEWLATHPLSAERTRELEAFARERGFGREGALVPLPH
jgi:Zn-dependent protease with chaperone function